MKYLFFRTFVLISAVSPVVHLIPAPTAALKCDSTALTEAADAHVASQTAGQLLPLQNFLAGNWTYQENNK
jgi:hypothetical protein